MCCATRGCVFSMTYGSNWKGKDLKFDTSGELIFRYAENTRPLLPAKSLSRMFSVSISGGAAPDFVARVVGGFESHRGRSACCFFIEPPTNHFSSARGVVFSSTAQDREQGLPPTRQ